MMSRWTQVHLGNEEESAENLFHGRRHMCLQIEKSANGENGRTARRYASVLDAVRDDIVRGNERLLVPTHSTMRRNCGPEEVPAQTKKFHAAAEAGIRCADIDDESIPPS